MINIKPQIVCSDIADLRFKEKQLLFLCSPDWDGTCGIGQWLSVSAGPPLYYPTPMSSFPLDVNKNNCRCTICYAEVESMIMICQMNG